MSSDVIGYIIGAGGLCFGVYSYFTSGVLADKTKIIEQGMQIKHFKENQDRQDKRIDKLEERIDEMEEYLQPRS